MKYACTALALMGLSTGALAATVVETTNPMGQTQKIWLEGQTARMEGGRPGTYMLMLLDKKKMYAINDEEKQIMDVTRPPGPPPGMPPRPQQDPPKLEAKLVKKGDGPEIAGYPTVHYQMTANGDLCSDEYLSAKVLELPDVQNFVKTMREMTSPKNRPMPFMKMDPCMQATLDLAEELDTLGMPMRSVDKDGKVKQEVKSIKTDAKAPAGSFDMPKDYGTTTPQEMMQRAMQRRMEQMTPEERQRMQEMRQRMHRPPGPPPQ